MENIDISGFSSSGIKVWIEEFEPPTEFARRAKQLLTESEEVILQRQERLPFQFEINFPSIPTLLTALPGFYCWLALFLVL
jgi:hypothetical protein